MKLTFVWLVFCLCVFVPTSQADDTDDIYKLVEKGRWREASERLTSADSDLSRGNAAFLQGLLERRADRAASLFESALERRVDAKYQEEIYFRLAQYYLLKNNFDRVSELATEYRSRWERGRYRAAMSRMNLLATELDGDRSAALSLIERYLKAFSSGPAEEWGKIDKARILVGENGDPTGIEEFAELTAERSDVIVPQSLYVVAMDALDRGKQDLAIRHYELLREEYPDAIGVDMLARELGDQPRQAPPQADPARERDNQARPEGSFAVKVGAFSSKQYAEEQVERLRRERVEMEIEKKEVSGRDYWIVLFGKYRDEREADRVKDKLEKQYGEEYEVVPR